MSGCKISSKQLSNITTTVTKHHSQISIPYVALDNEPSSSHSQDNRNVDVSTLTEMVKNKNLRTYRLLGEVEGIAAALETNLSKGISGNNEDINWRSQLFGKNTYHKPSSKGFLYFLMQGFKDPTVLVFLVCAALALVFGIKVEEGRYDGGNLFVALFLLVAVSAFYNVRQETELCKLPKVTNDIKVKVMRDGRLQQVSISDLLVGDILRLDIGDQIPADGLFFYGYSFRVDESSMTGENHHVEVDIRNNPFLISGSKVVHGYAVMLVVSVGMNTAWGEMMSLVCRDSDERTPLQARFENLISSILRLGVAFALIVIVYQIVYFFTGKTKDESGNKEFNGSKTDLDDVFSSFARIVMAAVTIVVAAIPVGLPFSVTLVLPYSMKRMLANKALTVRKLSACEKLGSATAICTDKTGLWTLNHEMEVAKFWIGQQSIDEESYHVVASDVRELFYQAVSLNKSGSVFKTGSGSAPEFSGSPTERAIISWAVSELRMDIKNVKQRHTILRFETFNSENKRSGISIRKKADNTIHVHWKGAAEIILAMCSHYYESNGVMKNMDKDEKSKIENIINDMAGRSLRCIGFAHKQITEEEMEHNEDGRTHERLKEDGLTFLGIVALEDPCLAGFKRDEDPCLAGFKRDVEMCKLAGVDIKMITGDNVFTATTVAAACGILGSGDPVESGEVIEGSEFRNYTHEERVQNVDKIRAMATSSPTDKLLMIQCLKKKGHVVAVTGDGINDVPALKEADIGISVSIQSPEVAKESSDMLILDGNFTSLTTLIQWGRCVHNNIQKLIQFQLTVNVTGLVVNFISIFVSGEVLLTAIQLLWVNLIMGTLEAVALSSDKPINELMKSPPHGGTAPIITNVMWRNLLSQTVYQIAVLFSLKFKSQSFLGVSSQVKATMIFNTFVLCQVFNEFNARSLEEKNIFKGIHKDPWFLAIAGITMGIQVLTVELELASAKRLSLLQWADCIAMATLTWLVGWIVKFMPVPEKPWFVNSNGDLDFGFGKCIKFLCCCFLKFYFPHDCD